jgi:GH15 family glucan-1,4-alpha-glucosidase
MALKVVYRVDGSTELPLRQRKELNGYRDSRPVQFGNAAADMIELGSFGYLADCALTYLDCGGAWHERYSRLIERIATFTAGHWQELDSGIWELDPRPFVVSRVMSWVTLDRACRIFERLDDNNAALPVWRRTMAAIRREVLSRGWDERLNAFTQFYGSGTVDAALLLLPLLGFLPADDPRIEATIAWIEATLMVNGFLHRFVEPASSDRGNQPLGENEGAFIMCTCWLAHWYALRGELDEAGALLERVEAAAGGIFLLSEAIDGQTGMLLGNTPLLFSHVEYAKAAMALDRARRAEAKSA